MYYSNFFKTNKVFIIAEIGKNFINTKDEKTIDVYLKEAMDLVKSAKEAGADAVKFQTHNVEDEQLDIDVVSPHFKGSDRYSWVSRNDHSTPIKEFWKPLKEYCDSEGIIFFSTPMSRGAAKKLQEINVELWKVGSGDLLDFVMLDYLAKTKKMIILSSGMSTLEEIDLAVDFLKKRQAEFALLHCVSKYPCPPHQLNLATIDLLQKRYKIPVGFSDHSVGMEGVKSSIAAVQLGARIIEKHFSFSREAWGSDHKASILPEEMNALVKSIREIENGKNVLTREEVREYLGKNGKTLQEGEAIFRPFFRKSLVAGRDIKKGEKISSEMIYAMRPQAYVNGLHSEEYENVLGRIIQKPLRKFDPITKENF